MTHLAVGCREIEDAALLCVQALLKAECELLHEPRLLVWQRHAISQQSCPPPELVHQQRQRLRCCGRRERHVCSTPTRPLGEGIRACHQHDIVRQVVWQDQMPEVPSPRKLPNDGYRGQARHSNGISSVTHPQTAQDVATRHTWGVLVIRHGGQEILPDDWGPVLQQRQSKPPALCIRQEWRSSHLPVSGEDLHHTEGLHSRCKLPHFTWGQLLRVAPLGMCADILVSCSDGPHLPTVHLVHRCERREVLHHWLQQGESHDVPLGEGVRAHVRTDCNHG